MTIENVRAEAARLLAVWAAGSSPSPRATRILRARLRASSSVRYIGRADGVSVLNPALAIVDDELARTARAHTQAEVVDLVIKEDLVLDPDRQSETGEIGLGESHEKPLAGKQLGSILQVAAFHCTTD